MVLNTVFYLSAFDFLPLSPKCAADPDLLLFSVLILHSCNLSHSQSSKILGSSVGYFFCCSKTQDAEFVLCLLTLCVYNK